MGQEEKEKKPRRAIRRKYFYAVIAVILAGGMVLSATMGFADFITGGGAGAPMSMPNDVVATVDGEEITVEELEAQLENLKASYRAQGMEPDSPEMEGMLEQAQMQILEEMISMKLLEQRAEEKGIEAPRDKIEEQYQEIVEQFGDEEALLAQLEEFDLTKDELMQDIEQNATIQHYINLKVDKDELEVSEEEIRTRYEEHQEANAEENEEEYEEMKPQLEQTLKDEKERQQIQSLLEELRQESDIEVFM